jgi:methane/phenol/toluene hydroxylase
MARITLNDPSRFKDPANLTWERYVALQSRERERYLSERAAIPRETLEYKTVGPRYRARAIEQFANNYFPELAATHSIATAAANAPFEELKTCCVFQLADEQRHLEMDREVFELRGQ